MSYRVIYTAKRRRLDEKVSIDFPDGEDYEEVEKAYSRRLNMIFTFIQQEKHIVESEYSVTLVRYKEEWNEDTADVIKEAKIKNEVYSV